MPTKVRCPICHAEAEWEGNPFRPFCSERCRLLDLGAWAEGRYRIPGQKIVKDQAEEDEDDEDEPQ
jgi:uncharacterized protein